MMVPGTDRKLWNCRVSRFTAVMLTISPVACFQQILHRHTRIIHIDKKYNGSIPPSILIRLLVGFMSCEKSQCCYMYLRICLVIHRD